MFIGSTLGRIAVTRARAEAVIAQLDSRLKNSERELRTGAADRDRTAALTDECASLVGIARGWGADYFPNFGAGGGELRRARDLVPQVELAVGAEIAAADSLDGKDFVDFGELTDLVDLRSLRGKCSASYQSKLLAAQDYWLVCAKGCTDGSHTCSIASHEKRALVMIFEHDFLLGQLAVMVDTCCLLLVACCLWQEMAKADFLGADSLAFLPRSPHIRHLRRCGFRICPSPAVPTSSRTCTI